MGEQNCNLCGENLLLDDENKLSHIVSSVHQAKLKTKMENWTNEEIDKSIVIQMIQGLSPLQIAEKISQIGPISDIYCHRQLRFAVVQMENTEIARNTLEVLRTRGHYVRKRSEITFEEWNILNLDFPKGLEVNKPWYQEHVNLFNLLTNPSIDTQIGEFFKRRMMKQQDYDKRNLLILELSKILNFGKIHPFGSFVTQICDSNSDVDIHFEDCGNGAEKKEKQQLIREVLSSLNQARRPDKTKFARIIKYLPQIRVPLIKWVHLETQIMCDISFENMMAVQNSKLIKFWLAYDPVVRPLMVLVRYWCRFHNLVHDGGLKNYAVSLLVVFFLMRKRILPSVNLLQSLVEPIIIGDWNTAFCEDSNLVKQKIRSKGINLQVSSFQKPSDVLPFALEFFDMISNIDKDVVICTVSGDFINREDFAPGNEENLPASQERYKLWAKYQATNSRINLKSRLCLQDPINLKHNVTLIANDNCIWRLTAAAEETVQLLRKGIQNQFIHLFTPIQQVKQWKQQSEVSLHQQQQQQQQEQGNVNTLSDSSLLSSTISFSIDKTYEELFLGAVKGLDSMERLIVCLQTSWVNNVHSFFDTVFRKVFDFDVKVRVNGTSDRMAIISNKDGLVQLDRQAAAHNNPDNVDNNTNEENIDKSNSVSIPLLQQPDAAPKRSKRKRTSRGNQHVQSNEMQAASEVSPLPESFKTMVDSQEQQQRQNQKNRQDHQKHDFSSDSFDSTNFMMDTANGKSLPNVHQSSRIINEKLITNSATLLLQGSTTTQLQSVNNKNESGETETKKLKLDQNFISKTENREKEEEKMMEISDGLEQKYSNYFTEMDNKIQALYLPKNNPYKFKYRDLSLQHLNKRQTMGFEVRGFYKFWAERDETTQDVLSDEKLNINNNANNYSRRRKNPMETEREVSLRIWKKHLVAVEKKENKRTVFDFCCIAKFEVMNSNDETQYPQPQVSLTFTELKKPGSNCMETIPFQEYISHLESILQKSFLDFIHFKLQCWLDTRGGRNQQSPKKSNLNTEMAP